MSPNTCKPCPRSVQSSPTEGGGTAWAIHLSLAPSVRGEEQHEQFTHPPLVGSGETGANPTCPPPPVGEGREEGVFILCGWPAGHVGLFISC